MRSSGGRESWVSGVIKERLAAGLAFRVGACLQAMKDAFAGKSRPHRLQAGSSMKGCEKILHIF
jgi:hypothetical protein